MSDTSSNSDRDSSDSHRGTRKGVPETGSFGKSTRRSKSRSTSAAPVKKEDPTLLAADAVFTKYFADREAARSASPQRKQSLTTSTSQQSLSSQTSSALVAGEGSSGSATRYVHKVPTEVILRGFKSVHQYAAIKQYENIAGRICEDYPRDPPVEERRFKSDIRDQASLRMKPLTPEEKAKALRFAGGENWIKVTFESAEAAESAIYASPQTILGHIVYAEPYHGMPPTIQDAMPATGTSSRSGFSSQSLGPSSPNFFSSRANKTSSTLPRSYTVPAMSQVGRGTQNNQQAFSPSESQSSSTTMDTGTLSTATASSGTVTGSTALVSQPAPASTSASQSAFCERIPAARRAQLLPASQALLPQQTMSQRMVKNVPLIGWFSADIIGTEVPRTEMGDFDWIAARWLDLWFGIFGGEVVGKEGKDD